MAAISSELAPTQGQQIERRIYPPVGMVGRILAPVIVLALGFVSQQRKQIFLQRLKLTHERLSDQREFKRQVRKLTKEALEFATLIQLAYTQFGQRSDRAWNGVQLNERGKRKKIAKIQFQAIGFTSELLYYKVLTRKRSIFGTRPTLPYGVRVSDLVTDEAKLQLETTLEREISFRLESKTGLWVLVHRLAGAGGIPRFVGFSEVMPHYRNPDRFQIILGIGERKTVHSIYLEDDPHILIGGATQTGKSNLVNWIICSLIRNMLPAQLQLILIDLKQVEFNHLEALPHLKYPIVVDATAAHDALAAMKLEMTKRMQLFNLAKAKNIQQYNTEHPNNVLPRIVCFIDEFAEIVNQDDTELAQSTFRLVKSITSVGRALGIHIFICTQRPDSQTVPMAVRNNCAVRIGGRTGDRFASQILIESDRLNKLPSDIKGRMAYKRGANIYEVQPPFISNEEIAESVGIARGRAAGVINLVDGLATIDLNGLVRWILKRNGGSMAQKPLWTILRDYGLSEKMLDAALADLRGRKSITLDNGNTYKIEPHNRSWRIVSPNEDAGDPQPEIAQPPTESVEPAPAPARPTPTAPVEPMPDELPSTTFDPIQMFIDDCCYLKSDVFIAVGVLHVIYVEWCKAHGYLFDPINVFSRKVKAKGFKATQRSKVRILIGLAPKSNDTPATPDPSLITPMEENENGISSPAAMP